MLMESCQRFGLNSHLYGMGEDWPWLYEAKVVALRAEIEKLDSDYILVSDGDDAFFLAGEDEILDKFKASRARILISADRQQAEGDAKWPQSILRDRYPKSPTPWRYCNSGGYLGKREDILDLLHAMFDVERPDYIPIWRSRDWSNDQFRMSIVYLNGYPLTVDTECRLFQTMGCVEDGEMEWNGARVSNLRTGSTPCHIHFNGNWPGMAEAFEHSLGAMYAH